MNAMVEQCERTLEEMRKLRQQHIEKKTINHFDRRRCNG